MFGQQLLARYGASVWAIRPETLAALAAQGGDAPAARHEEAGVLAARGGAARAARDGIAHIRIAGVIEPRASIWTVLFGGVGLDALAAEFAAAIADPDVRGVLLEVDSPGGSVYGVPEMARQIRDARGTKPILAIANAEAASAAYYLAAQADEVWVTPSGQAGSIGVVYLHTDLTAAAEQAGVRFRVFRSQARKADVNPYEALSEEAAADIQSKVDAYDAMFTADVALGRGVPAARVQRDFGAGRMMLAAEAVGAGLADRVGTVEEALARLAAGRVAMRPAASAGTVDDSAQGVSAEPADSARLARLWDIALSGRRSA